IVLGLAVAFCSTQTSYAQATTQSQPQKTRRSQRVRTQEVQVTSPNGRIKLTILANAERLTYTITFADTTVVEPSPIIMKLDAYTLSSVFVLGNLERYKINKTYRW